MKTIALALLVTLSIAALVEGRASADAPFGSRGWFSERMNGG